MERLIEDNDGLPVRLDGMTRTCPEQRDSPEYRTVRGRLEDFSAGNSGPGAVVTEPCEAAEITPHITAVAISKQNSSRAVVG
jgi:hypothetical protein